MINQAFQDTQHYLHGGSHRGSFGIFLLTQSFGGWRIFIQLQKTSFAADGLKPISGWIIKQRKCKCVNYQRYDNQVFKHIFDQMNIGKGLVIYVVNLHT